MDNGSRQRVRWAAATLLLPALSAPALGQAYPAKPITWVVPFPPGGIADLLSRAISRRMGEIVGQPFVVENRPGTGGSLATEQVARLPGDGYTVLYASSGTMAANLALYKQVRYDPVRDFVPIHGMVLAPLLLVTAAGRPFRSVADLVAHAKQNPDTVSFGSAGNGTGTHLAAALFQSRANVRLMHVPYKGSAPALQDLLGGQIALMFDYPNLLLPQIKAGRIRPLAVLGDRRLASLPDVPTIAEAGLKGAEASAWSGLVAPTGTPAAVVRKLAAAMEAALRDDAVMGTFIESGQIPLVDLHEARFRSFIAAETPKWTAAVRLSGASLDR